MARRIRRAEENNSFERRSGEIHFASRFHVRRWRNRVYGGVYEKMYARRRRSKVERRRLHFSRNGVCIFHETCIKVIVLFFRIVLTREGGERTFERFKYSPWRQGISSDRWIFQDRRNAVPARNAENFI